MKETVSLGISETILLMASSLFTGLRLSRNEDEF